jgi:threonylcarbamoyladenosine tRNA methylthiotransferase MtaB
MAEVMNFGCRLNIAEGEAIEAMLGDAEVLVINSCSVTAEAERQARQAIRRAARARPERAIILTGCGAETARERFGAMPELSAIVPNAEKGERASYLGSPQHSEGAAAQASSAPLKPLLSSNARSRAFISIQNGCDHSCTFCSIPQGRGKSRSAPIEAIVALAQEAVARGQQEVILTGVDLTSYDDAGAGLDILVQTLLTSVPHLPRLRLSSLDCIEISPLLEALITQEPRLMPHLHLSLQAGDDMILKRMKRRHSHAQAVELVARLKSKRPEIAIGADIIAGFPTESDVMFENSLRLVESLGIVYGHIFPYSPRAATPAARMPQVAPSHAKARAALLREAVAAQRARWFDALIGTCQEVLVENDGRSGYTPHFAPVSLTQIAQARQIARVRIIGHDGERLEGEMA